MSQTWVDPGRVLKATRKASVSVLTRFGAYVMRTARAMLRPARQLALSALNPRQRARYQRRLARAKRLGLPVPRRPTESSRPGEPPRSQTGLLRRWILFGVNPDEPSVVIGPALLPGHAGAEALEALEVGGRSTTAQGYEVTVQRRPFMGPAFQQELPQAAAMWRDSIQ